MPRQPGNCQKSIEQLLAKDHPQPSTVSGGDLFKKERDKRKRCHWSLEIGHWEKKKIKDKKE
jgi:hypothetical protein